MERRFPTVALVGRAHDPRVTDSLLALAEHLRRGGREVICEAGPLAELFGELAGAVPATVLARRADLVVAVGGDGTMLYAAQLVLGADTPLLGINRGRLGFLTDISPPEMIARLDEVLAGQYQDDVRALLTARLERAGQEPLTCDALNDVVVQKHATGRMIEFDTRIDGVYVNTHGGDGLVVATSTGSTAYALSCGGPIIHPRLDALVIAPISPHTLSDRPIVVGRHSAIEVRLLERSETRAEVTFDGNLLGELDHGDRLLLGAAERSVTLLHPHGHDFFRILRSKLHWGRSARNPDEPC
ncbi:MAG: NAD(+) kinase [Steroidobacteraceae bacterium]